MCQRIIVNKEAVVPGQKVPVIIQGLRFNKTFGINTGVYFVYSACVDTWELKWGVYDWNLCKILTEGYTEGSTTVYGEYLLSGLYKGENFLILTTKTEKSHKRTPVILQVN